jgi:hypothetical protein
MQEEEEGEGQEEEDGEEEGRKRWRGACRRGRTIGEDEEEKGARGGRLCGLD